MAEDTSGFYAHSREGAPPDQWQKLEEHLAGTALMTDSGGTQAGSIKYSSFGATRSSTGTLPAQKFTGQRLDNTGLYFYNARYYDPNIGRFISPDSLVPNLTNPQAYNRYSYVLNNPLKYVDPSGHIVELEGTDMGKSRSAECNRTRYKIFMNFCRCSYSTPTRQGEDVVLKDRRFLIYTKVTK